MKKKAATLAIGATALVASLIYFTNPALVPRPHTVALFWHASLTPDCTTEVWHSTNLLDWTLLTNTIATNLTVPAVLPAEFFKIRARDSNGWVSDWSRK